MQDEKISKLHSPVLVAEVKKALNISNLARLKQSKLIDATLGLGGQTIEFVKAGIQVLGIEADKKSLELARKRIEGVLLRHHYGGSKTCPSPHIQNNMGRFFKLVHGRAAYRLVHGNFRDIDEIARINDFFPVDAILFDLGISSFQLEDFSRGFSFQDKSAVLDMRIDKDKQSITAADLLNALDKKQLLQMFGNVIDMNQSRRLSQKVIEGRSVKKFSNVGDFLGIIEKPKDARGKKIHFATLPFLALRIAVNSEIDNLNLGLEKSFGLLKKGGRLAVITFHSGEDRVVKTIFNKKGNEGVIGIVNKKPIIASDVEVKKNPRSRSAKMRVVEKL